jgi:hypothetical protein
VKRPPSLDTDAVTQRGTHRITHNSTSSIKHAGSANGRPLGKGRLESSRDSWTGQLAELTALHREKRARAFEARARELASERRAAYRTGGVVARSDRGKPFLGAADESIGGLQWTGSAWRVAPLDATRESARRECFESTWHTSRARGKRRLFEKLAECGSDGRSLELVCRNSACGEKFSVPVGCGAAFFCPACRKRRAAAFRVDFQRKQLGLVSVASRAGLTQRFRRRAVGGRFGERLVTLTVPHTDERGTPLGVSERITVLRATWERFWRLFRDDLRGRLRGLQSGITLDNTEVGLPMPRGKSAPRSELALFELVSSLRVLEWTPGSDGMGHPHFHVWLFSPFIDRARLASLWSRAYAETTGATELCRLLIVDVRAPHECDGGLANELVKYLTKDWQVTSDGVERVRPEVFAQVYATLDGTRLRQSSQGLAHWAVARDKSCPCCAFSSEREHWARVFVIQERAQRTQAPSLHPPEYPDLPTTGQAAPLSRAEELRAAYDAKRDAEWRSFAGSIYRRPGMLAAGLRPVSEPPVAKTHSNLQRKFPGF